MQKIRITALFALIALLAPLFANNAQAASVIQTYGQVWSQGDAFWQDSIIVEPGEEFKINLFAGNYVELPINANNVIIIDNLPTYNTTSGTGVVNYVSGSTFYDYTQSGNWLGLSDDSTSPFDGSGLPVSSDGILNPFEGVNYKYSVKIPNVLPAGINNLNWSGPVLNFEFNGAQYSITNNHTNTITIQNLPSISSFAFNKTSFVTGDTISISVTANSGKQVHVEIGSISISLSEINPGQYTGQYTIPNGVVANNQTATLYVFNSQNKGAYLNYGSLITIGASSGGTDPVIPPTPSSPSSASFLGNTGTLMSIPVSASGNTGYLENAGDYLQTRTNNGVVARISIDSKQEQAIKVNIAEANYTQRASSPMNEEFGSIIENIIFSIKPENENSVFPTDATLYFVLQENQLNACDHEKMRIAYFSKKSNKWIAYYSEIPENENYIYASVYDYGVYGLVCYSGNDEGYIGSNEDGTVQGSSIGTYPNGTLLKSVDNNDVWYISGDQKHLVSPLGLQTRFDYKDIITLPSTKQIDVYARGSDVGIAPGILVKEQGSTEVYRISANQGLQQFDSHETLSKRGYKQLNIIEVGVGGLINYPFEALISNPDRIYSGDLVKTSSSSSVYYVDQGVLYPILSWDVFEKRMFNPGNIINVKNIHSPNVKNVVYYPDGTLIKGKESSVYVISNGMRRPIRSFADFKGMLYDENNIVHVPNEILEIIPVGRMIQLLAE